MAERSKKRRNDVGQRWNKERVDINLRLPRDLELTLREMALSGGDLSVIVLAALVNTDLKNVEPIATRYAGLDMGRNIVIRIGSAMRQKLYAAARKKEVSINGLMISVLRSYFTKCEKNKSLRDGLLTSLRARRGI